MTQQTSPAPGTALDRFFNALRGLGIRRRTEGKVIGGVCGGIADRLGVDVVIVRVITVLLVILGGVGISAYLVAWVLLPDVHGQIAAERALRHGDGGSVLLLVVAAIAVFSGFPWWFGRGPFGWTFPWGLLILAGLFWWLWTQRPAPVTPGAWVAPTAPPSDTPAPMPSASTPPGGTSGAGAAAGPEPTYPAPAYQPSTYQPSAYEPSAYQPPAPYPPRARRRTGGLLMTLVAVGVALVAYGTTLWVGNQLDFAGDHQVIALAAALGALGLVVVGLGVAGWRAGFVGFLAVVMALVTLSATTWSGTHVSFVGPVGDTTWQPTTVGTTNTYHLAAGNGVLDLAGLPSEGLTGQPVDVSIGAGNLTIRVPSDLTVQVRGHVGIGSITLPAGSTPDNLLNRSGTDVSASGVVGSGPTELLVKANVGLGQITVVKE